MSPVSSPLFETDIEEPGIVDPAGLQPPIHNLPDVAVMCFFQEVIEEAGDRVCANLSVYGGRPVYEDTSRDARIAFFYPGLGAPAAISSMEEMIAFGCRTFIAVGGAGALVPDLALGHAMVVDRALRDEGTSHHYLPPSRFVDSDSDVSEAILKSCRTAGLTAHRGTTWTTDAIFRETRSRVIRRVSEGCSMVEMEAAAFFAVAKFRGVRVGQLLYAGDTLVADDWDGRDWTNATQTRTALFNICLDAAATLATAASMPTGQPAR